jgi:uncharacterized Zn finger protein
MKLYLYCDGCGDETEHELVRRDKNLYRCRICGSVQVFKERDVEVKAVISTGEFSEVGKIRLKESDVVNVGDELVVETEEDLKVGMVTAIEVGDKRVQSSEAKEIDTLWLRNIGEVDVKFSLHKGAVTTPYKLKTSGETEFEIGERITIDNLLFKITRIKTIDGKLLKRDGERAKAKDIRRIYAMFLKKRR